MKLDEELIIYVRHAEEREKSKTCNQRSLSSRTSLFMRWKPDFLEKRKKTMMIMKENWRFCAQLHIAKIILNFGHIRDIHPGAVDTLFLMLSCLSDIPRPHLKSTRHDKKKQRGKSRQRTTGADAAMYVELSVHAGVFFLFFVAHLQALGWCQHLCESLN